VSRVPWKHVAAVPSFFLLYFYGLSRVGLIGPDEPRYASIGREMAQSGDFITPRLWGETWFEKPALLYWLIAAAHRAGLEAELAARVPVAIVSVAFLFLFFHRLRREFGEPAASYSTAVLATSAGWLAYSHVAVTDIALSATFAGAVLLCLPWVRSGGRRGLVMGGMLLGCAVLAKGLVPLALAAPIAWIAWRRWKDLLLFAAACLAVAAPWYVVCWIKNGDVFVQEFIVKHHFGRFTSPELQHVQPWWFYFPVLAGLLFPWTPGILLLFRREQYLDARRFLLAAVVVLGFVFFSVSTNKLPGYLLPLLPPLAALVGVRLAEAPPAPGILAACAILVAVIPVAAHALPVALVQGASRAPVVWAAEVYVLPVLALAALCWWAEARRKRPAAVGAVVGAVACAVVAIKTWVYPVIDATATARPVWRAMQLERPEEQCAGDLPRAIRYGLNYYAQRALPECDAVRQRSPDARSATHDTRVR
jgi:4-amino-4-deoxy-L-arabinose transferase-like glycosyltransferase